MDVRCRHREKLYPSSVLEDAGGDHRWNGPWTSGEEAASCPGGGGEGRCRRQRGCPVSSAAFPALTRPWRERVAPCEWSGLPTLHQSPTPSPPGSRSDPPRATVENRDWSCPLRRRPSSAAGAGRGGMTLRETTSTHAYGEASYWDQRYRQDQGPFDWYQKYRALSPLLDLYLRRTHRVLLVGCGNSALGEEMVDDGYGDIVNIDISSVIIEAMQKKYQDRPEMKYIKMDVRDMGVFESGSFEAVIDKGTLDSLMCGHNAQENATKMLEEVDRILKDKGVYILITYGDPKYRLYLLKAISWWNVNLHVIDRPDKAQGEQGWALTKPAPLKDGGIDTSILGSNPEIHYIYVCIKDESLRHEVNVKTEGQV